MPVVGYVCPSWTERGKRGEWHEPQYCILKCDEKCMSPGLIAAITKLNQDNHHRGRYVSATSLAGCSRRLFLERTQDYAFPLYEDGGLWHSFRGSIIHQALEAAADFEFIDGKSLLDLGFLVEWTMKVIWCLDCADASPADEDVDPHTFDEPCPKCGSEKTFVLGGTLDMLSPAMYFGFGELDKETGTLTCILEDNKTFQDYVYNKFVVGDPKEHTLHPNVKSEYVWQSNIYKFLAERSTPPKSLRDKGVRRLVLDHSRIQAIAMGRPAYLGSKQKHTTHYTKPEKVYDLPVIRFMPEEDVRDYIQTRAPAIYHSLITGETNGEICEPARNRRGLHSWQCMFCAFPGTEHCPDAKLEWQALLDGASKEDAFARALAALDEEEEKAA